MTNETEKLTTNMVASYFVGEYVAEHEHGWGRDSLEEAERNARTLFFAWLTEHEQETRDKEARRAAGFIASYLESVVQGRKRMPGNREVKAYEDGMREVVQLVRSLAERA